MRYDYLSKSHSHELHTLDVCNVCGRTLCARCDDRHRRCVEQKRAAYERHPLIGRAKTEAM